MTYRFQLLYSRKEIKQLQNATVALCGLGGYGAALVDPFARYEFRELRLADPDRYEESNMDRQCLAKFSTIGRLKVDVAARVIKDITKYTKVVKFPDGILTGNISPFCRNPQVIVDLCDQLSAKLLLHMAYRQLRIPLIAGGSIRWPSRQGIRVSIYRYDQGVRWLETSFRPQKWGITGTAWNAFKRVKEIGDMPWSVLRKIDLENAALRNRTPLTRYGVRQRVVWNAPGGYDPLKVYALTCGILELLIGVLINREPAHHRINFESFS